MARRHTKVLTLYEQQGDTLILPFGTLRTLPDCISKEGVFTSSFADAVSVDYGGKAVPLYDYNYLYYSFLGCVVG